MTARLKVPGEGFYYHYKHDLRGSFNNYAYEVMGVGHHTEKEGTYFVVYRPLYESASVYKNGKMFDIRPLSLFMEEVEKKGVRTPRFEKIEDSGLRAKLKRLRNEMYP